MLIRDAVRSDFAAIAPIYAHYVLHSPATFELASINGTLARFVTSARGLAPVAAGVSRTVTGSYTAMLIAAGAATLASAVALLAAHRAHDHTP